MTTSTPLKPIYVHATPERWGAEAAAVVGAVVCGVIAADGTVPGWERSLFHAINDLPDWLRSPMWLFQLAGMLGVPVIVALGAALFRKWRLAITLLLFVPLKLLVEKQVVKQLVERQRPGTSICHLDATCGHFRDVPLQGLSFVSGHAIIAWGMAALLWPYLGRHWRWVPVVIATLNAIARVYLGAHNPLDVIGGACVGVAIGVALTMIAGTPASTLPPEHAEHEDLPRRP